MSSTDSSSSGQSITVHAKPTRRSRGRCAAVLPKLFHREIFGDCRRGRSSKFLYGGKRLVTNIPNRFAFPLKSIVDRHTLYEEGHVFLGFSSCDQFLISYTEKEEVSSHTGFLSHVYSLHWWLFIVGSSAKKVGSIRLFGNEEIEYSLCLCYAEWPGLKSQIIVYGWRKSSDSYYITIAAVPSITNCNQCQTLEADNASSDLEPDEGHDRCLRHGFAIHFKQASSASQFGVLNTCGLKIDGMLVLNIGHSIVVISTGILEEENDVEELPLSSIKRADKEESVMDSDLVRALRSDDQLEEMRREKAARRALQIDAGSNFHEMAWSINLQQTPDEVLSQKSEDDDAEICHKNECFKSPTSLLTSRPSVYDIKDTDDTACITLVKKNFSDTQTENTASSQFDEYDFDNLDEKPTEIVVPNAFKLTGVRRLAHGRDNGHCARKRSLPSVSVKLTSISFSCSNCARFHSKQCSCAKASSQFLPSSSDTMQNEEDAEVEATENSKIYSDGARKRRVSAPSKVSSPLMVLTLLNNKLQNLPDSSRSDLSVITPSPSASESSGSMYCSAESHLSLGMGKYVTESKNSDGLVAFSENFYGPIPQENITPDDPLPVGEGGVYCYSMHCQGACGEMLHPLKKGQSAAQAFSQHLVLDLEHVIFDILRTRCYNAYKYGYLVDYEANITDVCKATKSVVIHIAALLDIAPHRSQVWPGPHSAEFILCWRLHTGRYEVVVARPLQLYDAKKMGPWDGKSINKMDCEIRQLCSVSANPYRSIYLLDNAAVFRRRSLNVLWNCDKTIAITK